MSDSMCTVMAYPSAEHQWYKDGDAIPAATDAELTIVSASQDSAGTYHCVSTNATGSAQTRPAVIIVVPAEPVVDNSAPSNVETGAFARHAPTPTQPVIVSVSPAQLVPVPCRAEVCIAVHST